MEGDGAAINIGIENMEDTIQEWMGQALTPVDLAKIYAAIIQETNRQLEIVMGCMMEHEI